jgi:tRNA-modifying protein YgfZ
MDEPQLLILDWRAAIAIGGEDAVGFLQGLTSNDVTRAAADRALWSAFLTPQGKFLHEFMILRRESGLLLDCERERRADLLRRLKLYRLRAKVTVEEGPETIVALYGPGLAEALGFAPAPGEAQTIPGGIVYGDPRLAAMGLRGAVDADGLAWLRARGLAEGSADACGSPPAFPTAAAISASTRRSCSRTASTSSTVWIGPRAATWARS